MNSFVEGPAPVVAGRALTVGCDGRIVAAAESSGVPVRAGDGIARGLARLVVHDLRADAPERAIAVDQTNTSVIVDDRFVVKIVGEWGAADRAGRLLERLAAAGSDEVARLHGIVEWHHPDRGTAALAIVTEYLPDAHDGWTWAVDDVLAHLAGVLEPTWPAALGAQIARMHGRLAVDAAPAPADTPSARRARAEAALAEVVDESIGAAGRLGSTTRLRNRRAALARAIRSLDAAAPGLVFPIHGDLHVGQILASPASHPRPDDAMSPSAARRYTIIDFDGDPQRAPADRDLPDAAARDIAHLLVSFELVAAVVQKRLQRAEPAAWAWADRARGEFLDAYRAALDVPDLFDPALLAGFEAEQLLAELAYADRFLPRWRYAPDAVISHRYESSGEHPDVPWTPPPLTPQPSPPPPAADR